MFSTDILIQDIFEGGETEQKTSDQYAFKFELDVKNKGEVHLI